MNGFSNNLISYGRGIFSGLKQAKHIRLSYFRKVFSLIGKKEKIALLTLTGLAAVSLFISLKNFYYSHTLPAAADGGSYSEGLLGQPGYINPLLAHSDTDLALTRLVFSGLYKFDSKGLLTPDLAEGLPIISQDQKQYTVNLKKNAKWHDDKPFNADDVIFTFQTIKDPAYKSPLRGSWSATAVEKLSDYSVRFTTKDISGPFIFNLVQPILPQHLWSRVEPQNFVLSKLNLEAVGTGPFAIKEIKKLPSGKIEQISLDAFAGYHNGRPKLSLLTIKFYDTENDVLNALHSKEITGYGYTPLGSNLYLDKSQSDFQVISVPLPQYQVVFFNLNNKVLSDPAVRTALSLATDKQKIIDAIFKGNALLPADPLLFDARGNSAAANNAFDLEKAKKNLDAAGWTIDAKTGQRAKKNISLAFTITTNDFLLNSKAAESLAAQWKQLNISVNLDVVTTQQLTDNVIRSRAFDVLLFPQKFGVDPDPFIFWHSSQIKDPGVNITGFSDPAADKLITEARTTTNQDVRQQKYQQFNQLISQKVPAIFLDQTEYIYAVDKNIKNISISNLYEASQRFYDIPKWYLAEKRVWK